MRLDTALEGSARPASATCFNVTLWWASVSPNLGPPPQQYRRVIVRPNDAHVVLSVAVWRFSQSGRRNRAFADLELALGAGPSVTLVNRMPRNQGHRGAESASSRRIVPLWCFDLSGFPEATTSCLVDQWT